jgi:hypothetical protein
VVDVVAEIGEPAGQQGLDLDLRGAAADARHGDQLPQRRHRRPVVDQGEGSGFGGGEHRLNVVAPTPRLPP